MTPMINMYHHPAGKRNWGKRARVTSSDLSRWQTRLPRRVGPRTGVWGGRRTRQSTLPDWGFPRQAWERCIKTPVHRVRAFPPFQCGRDRADRGFHRMRMDLFLTVSLPLLLLQLAACNFFFGE